MCVLFDHAGLPSRRPPFIQARTAASRQQPIVHVRCRRAQERRAFLKESGRPSHPQAGKPLKRRSAACTASWREWDADAPAGGGAHKDVLEQGGGGAYAATVGVLETPGLSGKPRKKAQTGEPEASSSTGPRAPEAQGRCQCPYSDRAVAVAIPRVVAADADAGAGSSGEHAATRRL